MSESLIISSWMENAEPWANAVQRGVITSRQLVTNKAIIEVIENLAPSTVLDIGCGEGWLVKALTDKGVFVSGVDVVPKLLHKAQQQGKGYFLLQPYDQLSSNSFSKPFDVAVCNFSLLGDESVEHLCNVIPSLLFTGGYLVIQTLHPLMVMDGKAYKDGWREGSWQGIEGDFSQPAPWYFRTLTSWVNLLEKNGLKRILMYEPLNPLTELPASFILVGRKE